MRINYNGWFYQQHHYTQGTRDGIDSYNDTKWKNINERLKTLKSLQSSLLTEQPYGVIANRNGLEQLIALMDRSDYTFSDVNDALIDTYKMSLQNAMSNMVVNTHAVIAHKKSTDPDVKTDATDYKYYIVDVPYQQMHFGDRDEMIRQQLSNMFRTGRGNYVHMDTMIGDEITKLLGFSFVCVTNGYICNDWLVAFDDRGFHFKIGWTKEYDVEFIVYKLDVCGVHTVDVSVNDLRYGNPIPVPFANGTKCIVDLFDVSRRDSLLGVPNFGMVNASGLQIMNIQQKSFTDWSMVSAQTVRCVVYGLKYLHELPDVYPAVNYYDMMYTGNVYTENGENVMVDETTHVVGQRQNIMNNMDVCTPPISVDRPADVSFDQIVYCSKLKETMLGYTDMMLKLGQQINNGESVTFIRNAGRAMLSHVDEWYLAYMRGATITSMITESDMFVFKDFRYRMKTFVEKLTEDPTLDTARAYALNEFYGIEYENTVLRICAPFESDVLKTFHDMPTNVLRNNYFDDYDYDSRFNRPISEQCFIALTYNAEDACWVFTDPDIKHFHGIGNTFYVNTKLNGDELFKFFIMYTDTENPAETNVEPFPFDEAIDFDKFMTECDHHIGYIRYWNVESHLRKLSKMMYHEDSIDTQTQILSQILHQKLNGLEFLDEYPSFMNYESSNASTDNLTANETDVRGPFAVNFLFYTVSMLYDDKDQLLAYFMRRLTKTEARYHDIDVSSKIANVTVPVNYGKVSVVGTGSPFANLHTIGDDSFGIFYGVPVLATFSGGNISVESGYYPYTFTVYDTAHFPYLKNDTMNAEIYIDNVRDVTVIDYTNDVKLVELLLKYLAYVSDLLNYVETNYMVPFSENLQLRQIVEGVLHHIDMIETFADGKTFVHPQTQAVLNIITESNNAIVSKLNSIITDIDTLRNIINGNRNIFTVMNVDILDKMKYVYTSFGFDDYAVKRIRAMYMNFREINNGKNLYEWKEWISQLDVDILKKLDEMIAANKFYDVPSSTYFRTQGVWLNAAMLNTATWVIDLEALYEMLSSLRTTHFDSIASFCESIISDEIKPLYVIDSITCTPIAIQSATIRNPYVVGASVTVPDINGNNVTGTLYFHPIYEWNGNDIYITGLRPICEYTFFDGTDITIPTTQNILNQNHESYGMPVLNVVIKLKQIGTTGDLTNDLDMIPYVVDTTLPFQHTHQRLLNDGDYAITEARVSVNYEMLFNNRFKPLEYDTDIVMNVETMVPESIDLVTVSNDTINKCVKDQYALQTGIKYYTKPRQVLHLELDQYDVIESIGGRYHVGQTLYLKTNDSYQFTFPIVITTIDHNESHGFIEAYVDYQHAQWNEIEVDDLDTYLTQPIACTVLDDNISNFLDEFSNSNYSYYPIPNAPTGDETIYTLPGDPCYVTNNAAYVYTRLDWMFNDHVPNRFPDDHHETYNFVYIGTGSILPDDSMTIAMINHNFNPLTDAEMYPVLRDEPNDHSVHKAELSIFRSLYNASVRDSEALVVERAEKYEEYLAAETEEERIQLKIELEDFDLKLEREKDFRARMETYIQQPQIPTTWYNVYAYDDAIIYINNGRAKRMSTPIINRRDLLYTDAIEVRMYDWEHKAWLNPNDFTISVTTVDGSNFNAKDTYLTNNVQYAITITPTDSEFTSKQILVYFVYKQSDIFASISDHAIDDVNVRFKTVAIPAEFDMNPPYADIRIRKHYDTQEKYRLLDFKTDDGTYIVKRIRRTGDYPYQSMVRWIDVHGIFGITSYDISNFDVYVKFPYPNINSPLLLKKPSYNATITKSIDGFTDNEIVTLICMDQTEASGYDGNTSAILFTASLTLVGDNPTVTILDGTTDVNGTYNCTVAKHPAYQSCGGIIRVIVTNHSTAMTLDNTKQWYLLTGDIDDRIVPDEFMLVPHSNVPTITDGFVLLLENRYTLNTNNALTSYMYYYDTEKFVRYPMSNIRGNRVDERLEIDQTLNSSIQKIKSNYIGIPRFAMQTIPRNGLIDMTGYLPTPLTRERYEFWVNGRCITNTDNLIILSPTIIQLKNLTSLHNFECIELVNDTDVPNKLMPTGTMYMDLEGRVFSSYLLMKLANIHTRYQSIQYKFQCNVQSGLDKYLPENHNPHNQDLEVDILSYINTDDVITSYRQLYHIPTINGVSVYHPTTSDLGLLEIPHDHIRALYQSTWSREICTNPLFGIEQPREYVNLHIQKDGNDYRIYTTGCYDGFFSFYISNTEDGPIEQVIPMLSIGTAIILPDTYTNKWIQCSYNNLVWEEIK